jgi:hypothetical protein
MSGDSAAVVAAALAAATAVVVLVACLLLGRRVRQLGTLVEELRGDTGPLVRQARTVVDQAATEMERVGDVLGSAEAVTATVDSASRLAYRAFSNPVVGAMAFASGLSGALRRLFGRPPRRAVTAPRRRAASPTSATARPVRHRGRRRQRSAAR